MARIKEIKISIHRKYTRDFQSYGYRIGVMLDVGKVDDARSGYYEGKAFLNERIAEEDLIIKNIVAMRVAEKGLGSKELGMIPEKEIARDNLGGFKVVDVVPEKKMISESGKEGDDNVLVLFDVKQIKRISSGAVLVELFGKKGDLWIPKSCIGDGDAMDLMQVGVKTMLRVKKWFLGKKGLM